MNTPVLDCQFRTNQNSHLQSHISKMFGSLKLKGRAKPSSSSQVWTGDEGEVPSSDGYANKKDVSSKSETRPDLSRTPAAPTREYQPRESRYLERTPSGADYTNKRLILESLFDYFTPEDLSSELPLLTLLCEKATKEIQKCNALTLEVKDLKRELARAQSEKYFSEQAIRELALELGLMGPRLGLTESQKILNKDAAAILESGGIPPLDIMLNGWTYIRVGKPGDGWDKYFYNPLEPFPPGRRRYTTGNDSSQMLPSSPKRTTSWKRNGGPARPPLAPQHTSETDGRVSPLVLPRSKRHTWGGNNCFPPGQCTPPQLPTHEGSVTISPSRPTHRHDAASASPGISSRYFNWTPDKKNKK
ncbi:hypothetical protein B9Z19DRAFT_777746 [Tuber borchii]|uniref:Uncharacterized protein n=1 Tax=Tuber borchii TaxID=42251 RepID=A0A2T6ZWQ6_TUBBO|nr:hypothetical protein B9Z19DRAFT_777746 [Tuber borchii]